MRISPEAQSELTASELCSNLRIIASDVAALSPKDRTVIIAAATELEISYRQLLLDNHNMTEMAQQQIALRERIDALTPKSSWSVSTSVQMRLS